ncbi:MAG: retropepsin-like aspartic protease [bacterium]
MPKFTFNPNHSIIICHGQIVSPKIELSLKMAIDTGAIFTIIPVESAVAVGQDPFISKRRIEITMGSSIEYVFIITLPVFKALGIEIKDMEVVCHNLPSPSPVEGLLGLNFLKRAKAIINFSNNTIECE